MKLLRRYKYRIIELNYSKCKLLFMRYILLFIVDVNKQKNEPDTEETLTQKGISMARSDPLRDFSQMPKSGKLQNSYLYIIF